jgi:hypothetical protein
VLLEARGPIITPWHTNKKSSKRCNIATYRNVRSAGWSKRRELVDSSIELNVDRTDRINRLACDNFDYALVPRSVATFLKGQAIRIRQYTAKCIIQIGKDLAGAKRYLGHGEFLHWVESEVGIPARTAQAYMRAAQWASDKREVVALLPPSLLYILSAESTPKEFTDNVLRRTEAGERVALTTVRLELKALREAGQEEQGRAPVMGCSATDSAEAEAICTTPSGESALMDAVRLLARALSSSDLAQICAIMTTKEVLEQPDLPQMIRRAFSAIDGYRALEGETERRDRHGSIVRMESLGREDMGTEQNHSGRQLRGHRPDPVGQRRETSRSMSARA